MSEETYTFEQARARLEEIAKQAKGASLEKSLDLLEEGVKLANVCTERIDHTRWRDEVGEDADAPEDAEAAYGSAGTDEGEAPPAEGSAEESEEEPEEESGDEPESGEDGD